MGLFGLLAALVAGADAHVFTPFSFLRRPLQVMRYFADVRGTLMTGPNFGYDLILDALKRSPDRLDLSSWRVAYNGAERVNPRTVDRFRDELRSAGVGSTVMFPVYGMAEATLAITFSQYGSEPAAVVVDRDQLDIGQSIVPVTDDHPRAKRLVAVGRPVEGMRVRVMAGQGPAAAGVLGEIEALGPSIMVGYHRDTEATARAFDDGWLRTGDLGFEAHGRLYIAGRRKEMVIVHGRNYFPEDVEAIVADLPGVFRGRCVAFADSEGDQEVIGVIVESSRYGDVPAAVLAEQLRRPVTAALGMSQVRIHLVPPRWLTRTTSGKWQRLEAARRISQQSIREAVNA
jgi:fatty-acyl-CoA synthase